ncbi:NfeD family protein [Ferrovibrio sp.]|uniref:NfeD family protein n=1 Tax=Ferrovibrio sp. TaxID=1917215 RepID=UPI002608CF4A|nr:NfeD family protein [Ferrovibrio sp.]
MLAPFTLLAWHWLAAGVALAVLEILVPGNVVIWIGIAAALVGLAMLVAPELSFAGQIGLFAVLAVLSLGLGIALRRRRGQAEVAVNIGSSRFIGQTAILESAIVAGRGEVILGDSIWPVQGPDLPAGSLVVITGSDGVLLTVEAKT